MANKDEVKIGEIHLSVKENKAWTWVCVLDITLENDVIQEDIDNSKAIAEQFGPSKIILDDRDIIAYAFMDIGQFARPEIWTILNTGSQFLEPGAILGLEGAKDEFKLYFYKLKRSVEDKIYSTIAKIREGRPNG